MNITHYREMENENTKILKELETNSEMGLVQGAKMIEAVDGLEPILEGILLTLNELPLKMGQPTESSNQEIIDTLKETVSRINEPIDITVSLNLI